MATFTTHTIKGVPDLDLKNGNIHENWKRWWTRFQNYALLTNVTRFANAKQIAVLLNAIGEEAHEIYDTFDTAEVQTIEDVQGLFEEYCSSRSNVIYDRYMFNTRDQQEEETFDKFLTSVRKLITACAYGDFEKDMLRDRIVLGIRDGKLRKKLLLMSKLTYEMAVTTCRTEEASRKQMEKIRPKKEENMFDNHQLSKQNRENTKFFSKNNSNNQINNDIKNKCSRCNYNHRKGNCPAHGKKCNKCNGINHFAAVCKSKNVNNLENDSNSPDESQSEDELFTHGITEIKSCNLLTKSKQIWTEKIYIKTGMIEFKLDTGSEVNILPFALFDRLNEESKKNMIETKNKIRAYGGQIISPVGICFLECVFENKKLLLEFYIIKENFCAILGLNACEQFGFVKRTHNLIREHGNTLFDSKEEFINKNMDIFEGLGKFPKKYDICLREQAIPKIQLPRRIPTKLRQSVLNELNKLLDSGVISKLECPTDWLHNLVISEKKDNGIRICLDPREINKYIKREPCMFPNFEEISAKLRNGKYFSVLDLRSGFHQIELTEKSRLLCSFTSPFGNYCYNRLPYGVMSAPEEFQRQNSAIFEDDNTVVYVDDILVKGSTIQEHDKNLLNVVEKARRNNIKFNLTKLQFRIEEVRYIGHVFSGNGIRPDEDRLESIKQLSCPRDKKDLQKFLGIVNYMRMFVPNLSDLTHPLRDLLKKNVIFQWLHIHTETVNRVKNAIINSNLLAPFDENKEIVIQTDASQNGLGTCLMQNGRPIAFASRSLSDVEKRYAQIEKEFLAITFSCKRFHQYIYGREIIIKNDHKPLVSIMNKDIHKIPSSKLQRMRIRLLNYNIKLEYIPGKYLILADFLSRYFIPTGNTQEDKCFTESIMSLSMTNDRKVAFQKSIQNDSILEEIYKFTLLGWPTNCRLLNEKCRPFFKYRNDIFIEDELLFYNNRLIIPKDMIRSTLILLHESHLGITKTQKRAKELVFWINMNIDIENLISACNICQTFRNKMQKEKLLSHEIPMLPFNKIGCDFFEFKNKDYIVIVDYFSKWFEFRKMRNKTSSEVIRIWKKIFCTFGIARTIIADNVPFNSVECRKFAHEWNIEIITSSPLYPKSNGLAERTVATIKNMLKKAKNEDDIIIALLEYRNTPLQDIELSPAQMLQSRRIRTKLPIHENLLTSQTNKDLEQRFVNKNKNISKHYDKNAISPREFKVGDNVYVRMENIWKPGKIINKYESPRSYEVEVEKNKIYRRNSSFIRSMKKPVFTFHQSTSETIDENLKTPSKTRSGKIYSA